MRPAGITVPDTLSRFFLVGSSLKNENDMNAHPSTTLTYDLNKITME